MGTYLSTPVTEKCDECGVSAPHEDTKVVEDLPVEWGVVDMQGWRKSMEDAHTAVTNVPLHEYHSHHSDNDETTCMKTTRHARVFGVYDGHGGPEVARFCQYYFVDCLVNQPTWVEHNQQDRYSDTDPNTMYNHTTPLAYTGLPLWGTDPRIPVPPPTPDAAGPPPPRRLGQGSSTTLSSEESEDDESNDSTVCGPGDPYAGTGNEGGYRQQHLPVAQQTPVGRALREAFHSMDRLIDDERRRQELQALKNIKPGTGIRMQLPHGYASIPEKIENDLLADPPPFYQKLPAALTDPASDAFLEMSTSKEAGEDEENDAGTSLSTTTILAGADNKLSEDDQATVAQQQADKSLSTVLSEEQAEAVRHEIEKFEDAQQQKNDQPAAEDDDSTEPVGLEEAAILDENIEDDNDNNENEEDDDCAGISAADAKTPPSPAASVSTEGIAATAAVPPPAGGKVTTMLQKILSLGAVGGGTAAATTKEAVATPLPTATTTAEDESSSSNNNNNNNANTTGNTILPQYPTSNEVTTTDPRHPSIIHNGRLVCNLPDHAIHAGATAVVAVITGNILTVANAGDSRAVLCRHKQKQHQTITTSSTQDANTTTTTMDVHDIYAYPMSYDHKPSQKHELDRITNSGGFVNHFGRINGNLNLSRSIGDLKYKQVPGIPPEDQMITAEPDIMQVVLNTTTSSSADDAAAAEADDVGPDEFLILGCDGIWDCVSNEEAVHFVYSRIDTKSLVQIGTELLDEIISDDPRISQGIGGDNMTIMIIDLQASKRTRNANPNQATTKTDTVV